MLQYLVLPDKTIFMPHTGLGETLNLSVFDWPPYRDQLLLELFLENAKLKFELNDLSNRYNELEAENKELKAANLKLFEQLHLDCSTSNIPPSKDWKKNNVFEEPKKTDDSNANNQDDRKEDKEGPISVKDYLNNNKDGEKKRPGGQKNHPPAFMRIDGVREGDPVKKYPDKCNRCPYFEKCKEEGKFRQYSTNHEYDIEVIRVHIEHHLFEATDCLNDGSQIRDNFPEVIGTQFYGLNIQLHILTWHHLFHGSYDRVALGAKELLGLSLSAGTANAIVKRASAYILSSGFIDAIRFFILLFETVLGVDETGARVGGRNAWVHTAATANVTLLIAHWRRGYEGTIYAGVVQFFKYTLLSDCWATYFNENFKCKHAICDSHTLRDLVAAAYFRQQDWAIEMFDLLIEVFTAKRDAIERGEDRFPQEYIDDIRSRYCQIVANGYSEINGEEKGKTVSLLNRLSKLEDAVLAFALDFNVGFTNNVSEQALRNLKVVLRVIGQFKTMLGLVDYCIIQSFIDTCRKQGHNPFDMLRILLSGGDIIEAVFGAEKAALIKQMIRLANAFAAHDTNEIDATKAEIAEMGLELTEELIKAASYGRFEVYNDSPPEIKKSSPAVPKDKMKAARERVKLKKASQTTTAQSSDGLNEDSLKKSTRSIRAGPRSA